MTEKHVLFHPILHAATLLEDRLRERLAPLGITPRQARVLVALDRMGSASQVQLVEEFQIKPASMSTMTVRLIANGYVKRQISGEDKRTNVLVLTDEGRAFLKEIYKSWGDIDAFIIKTLGFEQARHHSEEALELALALRQAPGQNQ